MEHLLAASVVIQLAHFVCARLEARRIKVASLARNPAEYEYLKQNHKG